MGFWIDLRQKLSLLWKVFGEGFFVSFPRLLCAYWEHVGWRKVQATLRRPLWHARMSLTPSCIIGAKKSCRWKMHLRAEACYSLKFSTNTIVQPPHTPCSYCSTKTHRTCGRKGSDGIGTKIYCLLVALTKQTGHCYKPHCPLSFHLEDRTEPRSSIMDRTLFALPLFMATVSDVSRCERYAAKIPPAINGSSHRMG